jgi:hypothetical protein
MQQDQFTFSNEINQGQKLNSAQKEKNQQLLEKYISLLNLLQDQKNINQVYLA